MAGNGHGPRFLYRTVVRVRPMFAVVKADVVAIMPVVGRLAQR